MHGDMSFDGIPFLVHLKNGRVVLRVCTLYAMAGAKGVTSWASSNTPTVATPALATRWSTVSKENPSRVYHFSAFEFPKRIGNRLIMLAQIFLDGLLTVTKVLHCCIYKSFTIFVLGNISRDKNSFRCSNQLSHGSDLYQTFLSSCNKGYTSSSPSILKCYARDFHLVADYMDLM